MNDILIKVGADITDFSRGMQNASKQLSNIGGSMSSFGKKMTKSITLPLAGLTTAAVVTGAKFDSSMSAVQAVTGATEKDFKSLRKQAMELGSATVYSASEAAQGMEMLGRAGFSTTEIMDTMPGMLDLAASGALDLGDAADITSNILSGFGMEASEAGKLADVLAEAAASSNTDVLALGEAFKYVGPVASTLGLSLEDTAAAIGTLGDAGISAGQAGNMMKRGLLNLSAPSKQAADLMKKLGINVFDAEGNMKSMPEIISELEKGLEGMSAQQKTAAMETLFGSEAVSGWMALVDSGSDSLGKFTKALENSEGAAKEQAKVMKDNLQGSFKELLSIVELISIQFYDVLKPALKKVTETLIDFVSWFSSLSDKSKGIIVAIAGIAAAIGPLIFVIGKVISAVKMINGALLVVNATIKANPFMALLALIIAVAALVYVYWEPISDFFLNLWKSIKEIFTAIWEPITEVWTTVVDNFMSIFSPIIDFFSSTLEIISGLFNDSWNALSDFLAGTWDNIQTTASAAWDLIKNIILGPILLLINLITGDFDELKANLKAIWGNIKDAAGRIWGALKDQVANLMSTLRNVLSNIWNGMKQIASNAWNAMKSTASNVWGAIKNIGSNIWNGIKDSISNLASKAKDGAIKAWNTLKEKTSQAFDKVVEFIKNPLKAIDLFSIGADIIKGLINGIGSMAKAVWDKAKSIGRGIADGIKGMLGIKSPSRVMMAVGKFTGQGLEKGILGMRKAVARASEKLAEAATPDVDLSYITPKGIFDKVSGRISVDNNASRREEIIQNITVISPDSTSPAENARKFKQASRELALELR